MDRGERPLEARNRLAMSLLLSLLVSGCGGSSNIQFSSGGPPQGVVANSSTVSVQGHTTVGALIAAGILAGVSIRREPERNAPFSMRVPEPHPARRIVEQDCTRPIEDWSANLRCR